MNRKQILGLAAFLLVGIIFWPWLGNPAHFVKWEDRFKTSVPVALAFGFPCETQEEGGTIFVDTSPECITFESSREYSGVWLSAFEGSTFIDGATVAPTLRPPYEDVAWLQLDPTDLAPEIDRYGYDEQNGCYTISAFRLRFIGRETNALGGHMGLWGSTVLPSRIISAEPIEAPQCNVYHGI